MTGDRGASNARVYHTSSRFLPFTGAISDIYIKIFNPSFITRKPANAGFLVLFNLT
jgi:hypothetical protein